MVNVLHRHLKNPRLWQLALACYWLALAIGTHMPIDRLALNPGSADKFAHLGAFGVLAILVAITWRVSAGTIGLRQLLCVWGIVVLYGAIEETTQPMVNRTASLNDWFADAAGAALGLAFFWYLLNPLLNRMAPASGITNRAERPPTWRRYSLRTLFAAMTLVALVCYWTMLPTINAQRFVSAINERDYAAADNLFIDNANRFFEDAQNTGALGNDPIIWPLTWRDLWTGQRHITLPLNAEAGGERVHFLVNREGVVTLSTGA